MCIIAQNGLENNRVPLEEQKSRVLLGLWVSPEPHSKPSSTDEVLPQVNEPSLPKPHQSGSNLTALLQHLH